MEFVELVAHALLVAEALVCLWLARWCWRDGGTGDLAFRLSARVAAALFAASACVIAYGLTR